MTPAPEDTVGRGSLHAPLARRALAGFFLSGILSALLGAILPAWGYHLRPNFPMVGAHFLCFGTGVVLSTQAARKLLKLRGLRFSLVLACSMACGSLLLLAVFSSPLAPAWRLAAIGIVGIAAGLLNSAVLHAIGPVFRHDPAAAVNLAGAFFVLGCLFVSLLVAGTFYVYTVPSILIWVALIPVAGIWLYAKRPLANPPLSVQPAIRETLRDLKRLDAVLFAILVFFQFGNEWSVAGWLALFLTQRLGLSPESSLQLLALYWFSLLLGRVAAISLMVRVRHGTLLVGSTLSSLAGSTTLWATDNVFGAVIGILLLAGGFAMTYPLVAEKMRGRFVSYQPGHFHGVFSVALIGGMLAPWSLGIFADSWGIGAVMMIPVLGSCAVFVLVLAIWLESRIRGHR